MQRSGFFVIRSSEPGQAPESDPGGLDSEISVQGPHNVRLDWIDGRPYITDLGSVHKVRVNFTPIESRVPFLIRADDTVSIGNVHLTWKAAPETEKPFQEPIYSLVVKTSQWTKEFPAREKVVRIGRAPDNDIHIDDDYVSRYHAELVEQAHGYEIVDLGSVNGLRFGNKRITRKTLADGDVVWVSSSISLTWIVTQPAVELGVGSGTTAEPSEDRTVDEVFVPGQAVKPQVSSVPAVMAVSPEGTPALSRVQATELVDMAQFMQSVTDLVAVSSTIVRNTQIPHLVIHLPKRTWEAQLTKEQLTIGREEENDISIPDASISRHHATIERRGDEYVIREAQSRNGIWVGGQRVEEHTLKDGDVLSLGRAKLIYKGGFTADDLTLIGTPRIDGKPARRPVVFVPGGGGSELWLGSERIWPNPKYLISNPEIYSLPGDPRIKVREIVQDVVIIPNLFKLEQYSRLGDYLETGLGYTRGKDMLEFAYDWRQDVRLASQNLAEAIERWQIKTPITIIAHSLGTLLTRYYVEKLGGKQFVERIILMGGPHYGTPKGLSNILVGPDILPLGIGDNRMRHVLATMPSVYQILPTYPCVVDQHGNYVDILKDDTWLPEQQRPFLEAARSLRRELGHRSSVPSVSIFGYGLKTVLRVRIHRRSDGQWDKVDFIEDTAGDLTVPSGSAVLKNSEIHPVFQEHGSLYVDDDVKMRLKVELTRSTTWQQKRRR